jgi:hypothetical protein
MSTRCQQHQKTQQHGSQIYAKTDHTIDQQDRQYRCKPNVRHVLVTILAAEKQEYYILFMTHGISMGPIV